MKRARVDTGVDPARGLIAAAVVHVVAFFAMGAVDPPEPETVLVQFDVAELPEPPKPKPPEPKPKEPEPEPEKEPEKPEPPKDEPKPKVRPKTPPSRPPPPAPPITTTPGPATDPGPFELPEDKTIAPTLPSAPAGDGKPGGREGGKDKDGGGGPKEGTGKPGPVWAPKSDLYIKKQPLPVHIAELECPAVQELRISGTVVLLVQVRRDGSVKQARVTKGIGHGCDEIAKKALRGGKFTPAIDTDGRSADYELRYEYVFELEG
jgi:protein TonB